MKHSLHTATVTLYVFYNSIHICMHTLYEGLKLATACGACTATSGSNGKIVGNGGSSDEASVAADCLSWLRGSFLDCCEAAVCSNSTEVLAGAAEAMPLHCRLVASNVVDKATARACPTNQAQTLADCLQHVQLGTYWWTTTRTWCQTLELSAPGVRIKSHLDASVTCKRLPAVTLYCSCPLAIA